MSQSGEKVVVHEKKQSSFHWSVLIDLIIIMAVLVSVKQALIPFTLLYAGPISTLVAMVVATVLLRRRGLGWKDLGFTKPKSWLRLFLLAALSLLTIIFTTAIFNPLADLLFEDMGTSGRFDHVEGNLWAYIGVMGLVWTHAAIFEEALFRAFIISKASEFLGGGLKADIAAVIFAAIFFGYRHYYYKGMHGALITGAIGLAMGLLYLMFGRKCIWPMVLGHGAINSIAMTLRFIGVKDTD